MKNVLITICGRAGSKGFKNKNLKSLLGIPLVYYTAAIAEDFRHRLAAECDTAVCLNTDSKELQELLENVINATITLDNGDEINL